MEIIKLKVLRNLKRTKLNNEHVTWDLKNNINYKIKKNYFTHKNLSKFNFSIDTSDDYLSIKKILEKYEDLASYEKILKNEYK